MSYQVSESQVWDPRIGRFVTEKTWEAFDAYPDPAIIEAGNEYDVRKTLTGGKYVTTYKVVDPAADTATYNYNYQLTSTLSTEPLITHPFFAAGGTYDMSAFVDKVKEAEQDPTLWKTYAANTDALGKYAELILQGIESYLNPSIILHVTRDEASMPNLVALGKIAEIENAPDLPGDANWLLSGATSEAIADTGTFRNTYEYRASGIQGWNSFLYTLPPA